MAVDYGVHQLLVNGREAGKPVDLYHDGVVPREPLDLGVFELAGEDNRLTAVVQGTNEKAAPKNYMLGLDCLVLEPEGGKPN
jgi:hypothetical protein